MTLESILPIVQGLISDKVLNTIQKEGPKVAAKAIYTMLPSPARMFIKEETFVTFFLSNKNKIIDTKAKKPTKKVAVKK
jgi:hypothetical protein